MGEGEQNTRTQAKIQSRPFHVLAPEASAKANISLDTTSVVSPSPLLNNPKCSCVVRCGDGREGNQQWRFRRLTCSSRSPFRAGAYQDGRSDFAKAVLCAFTGHQLLDVGVVRSPVREEDIKALEHRKRLDLVTLFALAAGIVVVAAVAPTALIRCGKAPHVSRRHCRRCICGVRLHVQMRRSRDAQQVTKGG